MTIIEPDEQRGGVMDNSSRAGGALVRAAAGDQGGWDELVGEFAPAVWSIPRGYGLSTAEAADVSQVTWLRLVDHLDRIEQPDRVGAWLALTARRESLRVLRLAGRQVPADDDFGAPADGSGAVPDRRPMGPDMDRLVLG
jgi:DNA-directed RNA polymerase specialized sigma24 family protein